MDARLAPYFAYCFCAWAYACAGRGQPAANGAYPGASHAEPAPSARAERPAPKTRARWERFAEVAGWPPINERSYASAGHFGGRFAVRIRVSPDARAAYESLTPGRALPPGSVVAAFHSELRDGRPGPVLAMIKREGGWEYLALDSEGRIDERGALPLCIRCHSEAVADQLFGPPRPHASETSPR
jgi:hypothetical protein